MSNLTPEQIFNEYQNREIDRESAIKYLHSFIEGSEKDYLRVKAVEILSNGFPESDVIFKLLENLIVSDSSEQIREIVGQLIINKYFNRSEEVINHVFKREKSMNVLLSILRSLETLKIEKSESLIREMEDILGRKYHEIFSLEKREAMGLKLIELFFGEDLRSSKFNHHSHESPLMFSIKNGHLVQLEFFDIKMEVLYYLKLFPKLEFLDIFYTNVKDFSSLKYLSNLHVLKLGGREIEEIKSLESLKELRNLTIYDTYIQELGNIENLINLKVLDLGFNQLSKIPDIRTLKNLKLLNLGGNQISIFDGSVVPENLEELNLGGNPLTEIRGMEHLKKLKKLNLKKTQGAKMKFLDLNNEEKEIILTRRIIKEITLLNIYNKFCIEKLLDLLNEKLKA